MAKRHAGESLVDTFERRNSLALILVQGFSLNCTILDLDIRLGHIALERQGVLHPLLVVALEKKSECQSWDHKNRLVYLLEVLPSVRTTTFLPRGGSNDGLHRALLNVTEFEGLNEVPAGSDVRSKPRTEIE